MVTSRKLKRWIALVLLAALAFAQASIAATACEMERRTIAQAVASTAGEDRGCEMHSIGSAPLYTNRCLAHCTADLQIAGLPVAIVRGAADVPVLFARPLTLPFVCDRLESPPPAAVPIRILLHSFLV